MSKKPTTPRQQPPGHYLRLQAKAREAEEHDRYDPDVTDPFEELATAHAHIEKLEMQVGVQSETIRLQADEIRRLIAAPTVRSGVPQYVRFVGVLCDMAGISPEALRGYGRCKFVLGPRRLVTWCLREVGMSFPEIASHTRPEGTGHSTVFESVRIARAVFSTFPDRAKELRVELQRIMLGGHPDPVAWRDLREIVGLLASTGTKEGRARGRVRDQVA